MASGTDWRSSPAARSAFATLLAIVSAALVASVVSILVVGDSGRSWSTWIVVTVVSVAAAGISTWFVVRRSSAQVREVAQRSATRVADLETEIRRLEAVVDGMSEGILVADAVGRRSFVNPRWRALFATEASNSGAGPNLEPKAELDQLITTTLESRQELQLELELSDPEPRTLILTSSPLSKGEGLVLVARDVTELLRLTEVRRDFVANVSHELRTPLSAIRGFAETLLDGAKDDPRASVEFLERILKQCRRLEALLSDLLTLSQMEHVETEGRLIPVDLESVVQEAIEVLRDRAAGKKLTLEVEIQPLRAIDGDAVALERLCVNLLDNAIKYNREGGSIRIKLYGSSREVVLEVADTGIGIPKGSERRLFERFFRVDKGRSRQQGGTGLGLAIVKHAASLHGGSVELESELGKGSLFRVRLPVK